MPTLITTIRRLEYANYLIRHKATGDLETFSEKMNLSKSAVKALIAEMKEMGAVILFDRNKKTYYYADDGEFCVAGFMKYGQILTRYDAAKIGRPEELCFSEKAVFVLCKDV